MALKNDPARAKDYFAAKLAFTLGPAELDQLFKKKDEPFRVIDVRAADDFQKEHIPGAINLPRDKWGTFEGLAKDKVNILYCYSQQCHLAAKAAFEFAGKGFSVMELEGGFKVWKDYKLPVEGPGAR